MTPSWFYALLAAVNVARITATRHDASSCCTRQPYAALRSLSKVPAIASYCSSKYPPPTTTKTTTALTVTVTIVTGNTVVTSAVDTRTSTVSEITTLTEPSTTTITSTTTILTTTTVSYVQPPNVKRSRQTPAAAQLRSFTGKAASIVKTACSCIQAPRTTTKTITPSTTIRAISTSISAVTAVVTITATRTETFTATVSETAVRETVAQVTVTAMPCPGGAPFARTEIASQRFFGICTSAAFPAFDRQGLENASGGTNTCLDVCDLYAVGSGPNRCLGVQYRPTEAASPSLTCTYQFQSATVLTANPTMEAAIAIGQIR